MNEENQPTNDPVEARASELGLVRGPQGSWEPDLSNPIWQGDAPVEYGPQEHDRIHARWIGQLRDDLPAGVPLDAEASEKWPSTWGIESSSDGTLQHTPVSEGTCLQCLFCRHYIPLETRLGMDWGACTNVLSQYDRQVVFEHWTCIAYMRKVDGDKRG